MEKIFKIIYKNNSFNVYSQDNYNLAGLLTLSLYSEYKQILYDNVSKYNGGDYEIKNIENLFIKDIELKKCEFPVINCKTIIDFNDKVVIYKHYRLTTYDLEHYNRNLLYIIHKNKKICMVAKTYETEIQKLCQFVFHNMNAKEKFIDEAILMGVDTYTETHYDNGKTIDEIRNDLDKGDYSLIPYKLTESDLDALIQPKFIVNFDEQTVNNRDFDWLINDEVNYLWQAEDFDRREYLYQYDR